MNTAEIVKTLMSAQKEHGLVEVLHRVYGKNIKVNVGFSRTDCNASIEELVLSVRSHNALRRANISTIGDLVDRLNTADLKSIRNLGAKSLREIQTKILLYGFERLSEKEKEAFFFDLVANNPTNRSI